MTLAERRHDRLAVRLSLIISRLLAGETLHVGKLAAEFGVSVRTLRRDFRERLMYLDLEYYRGMCRLRSGGSVSQRELDILTFAWRSGMGDVFPGLDRKMVNRLLACDESPCLVWSSPCTSTAAGSLSFFRLIQAITARQRVTLLAEGQRCERLAPCRLVARDGTWYLLAEYGQRMAVFSLDEIHQVVPSTETFIRNDAIFRLPENERFLNALPHFHFIQRSLDALSL
ncbi:WYL domain-containing protein [Enterobacter kobei]|uniref:DeoR family transcriptional regulator n=1 Tax=Citrobacter freundii TaxID=546 RepID=UPI000D0431F9|nr:WYL domain-containing protein [Citrobacter freundii]ELE9688706.1 WYL domain-containing protein [Enterobacter kobei]MBJ8787118.1 WYL domain-containing protein [Citrobacter freundii]QAT68750.1 WYL domain-containing protein [Citrobacter freundii]HDT6083564.1 WYL domain-containing protein [Citrobacter braakii]